MSDTETVESDEKTKLLPKSDLKPLEGTVDRGTGIEIVGRLLACELLQDGASEIVKGIMEKLTSSSRVLIVEDRALLATDWICSLVQAELHSQGEALLEAITAFGLPASKTEPMGESEGFKGSMNFIGPGAILSATSAAVGAVAGIVGMFRSNYSITSQEFAIGSTPLVAAVVQKLLALAPSPEVTVDQFSLLNTPMIDEFQGAVTNRAHLERLIQLVKGTRVQRADRQLEDLRTTLAAYVKALAESKPDADTTSLRKLIEEVKTTIVEVEEGSAVDRAHVMFAESISSRFDTFANEITASPKEGGYPPLVRAAIREGLHGENRKHTHVLFVGVEAAGGEMITRQAYFAKTGVAVIAGGEQISYLLLDLERNTTVAGGSKTCLGHLSYDLKNGEPGSLDRSDLSSPAAHENGSRPSVLRRFVTFVTHQNN